MKTRKEALEDLFDRTLAIVVDSEVTVAYLKTQDPKRILKERQKVFGGTMMKEDVTVEMMLKEQEIKVAENRKVLEVIGKEIEKEI